MLRCVKFFSKQTAGNRSLTVPDERTGLRLHMDFPDNQEDIASYSQRSTMLAQAKPSNIIYLDDGQLRLADSARVLASKFLHGIVTLETLVYEVPERIPEDAMCDQKLLSQPRLMEAVLLEAKALSKLDWIANGFRPLVLSNRGGVCTAEKEFHVFLSHGAVAEQTRTALLSILDAHSKLNKIPVDKVGVRRIVDPDPWATRRSTEASSSIEYIWVPVEIFVDWNRSACAPAGEQASCSSEACPPNEVSYKVSLASPLPDVDVSSPLNSLLAVVFGRMLPAFVQVMPSLVTQKRFQVVVKVQSYEMSNGSEYRGAWHREGIDAERIAAVGLYYPHIDPGTVGGALRLRPSELIYATLGGDRRDPYWPGPGVPIGDWQARKFASGFPAEGDDAVIRVKTGDCIVFSNRDFVHRVDRLSRDHSDEHVRDGGGPFEAACRVVVAFFVIDTAARLQSTADLGYRKLSLASAKLQSACVPHPLLRRIPAKLFNLICRFIGDALDDSEARLTQQELRQSREPKAHHEDDNMRAGVMDGWAAIDCGIMEFTGINGVGILS